MRVGYHLVAYGRLEPSDQKEQDKERDSSSAILEELDNENDASGGAPQMIGSGALFLISPKILLSVTNPYSSSVIASFDPALCSPNANYHGGYLSALLPLRRSRFGKGRTINCHSPHNHLTPFALSYQLKPLN